MPLGEFEEVTSQALADIEKVKEGLMAWETTTEDITARRVQPSRAFRQEFETSIRRQWKVVKGELKESLLGAGSQEKLVSTQSPINYAF